MSTAIGFNFDATNYFRTFNLFGDVAQGAAFVDINNGLQTTLAANHTNGDGVLQFTNKNFSNQANNGGNSYYLPGTNYTLTINLKDGASTFKIVGQFVASTGYFTITSFSSGSDQNMSSGDIIDTTATAWTDTNFNALPPECIDTGYPTGYPAGLAAGQSFASILSQNVPLPSGVYTPLADGTGTLVFSGTYADGTTWSSTITVTAGVCSPLTVTLSENGSLTTNQTFKVTASNISTPVHNISLCLPTYQGTNFAAMYSANRGVANRAYYVWHPQILSLLKGAACLRFMDAAQTNNQIAIVNWSDRKLFGWKYGFNYQYGLPLELQIALCNQLNCNCWICVPHLATDAYVTNLAKLLLYGSDINGNPYNNAQASPVWAPLNPGLKVYIESSNETWNSQFLQQNHWALMGIINFCPSLISSLTYSSGTGLCTCTTVNTLANLNILNGNTVQISGVGNDANYNGSFTATVTGANTFTYTPGSAPAVSPATARTYQCMTAFSAVNVLGVSAISWALNNGTVTVTTSSNHGFTTNDIVQFENASDNGFNQLAIVTNAGATSLTYTWLNQGSPRTVPTLTGQITSITASAKGGQSLKCVRLGSNGAISATTYNWPIARDYYAGRRMVQIYQDFITVFTTPAQQSALVFTLGSWAGQESPTGVNRVAQLLADLGGSLPTGPGWALAIAPYYQAGVSPQYDTTFLGTLKTISAISASGNTVTVTSNGHGFSNGDTVQHINIKDASTDTAAYCCVATIGGVTTNTYTFTAVETPSGAGSSYYSTLGTMYCVKNPPFMREIASVSYNSVTGVVTCVSYGHGFSTGNSIRTCNIESPGNNAGNGYQNTVDNWNNIWTITVVDANTFTFTTLTGLTAPTAASTGNGRPWAYPSSVIGNIESAMLTYLTGTVVPWLNSYQTLAAANGLQLICYESGQQLQAQTANQNHIALVDAYVNVNRDASIGYTTYLQTLLPYFDLIMHYSFCTLPGKFGSWGAIENTQQVATTSPKWNALQTVINTNPIIVVDNP